MLSTSNNGVMRFVISHPALQVVHCVYIIDRFTSWQLNVLKTEEQLEMVLSGDHRITSIPAPSSLVFNDRSLGAISNIWLHWKRSDCLMMRFGPLLLVAEACVDALSILDQALSLSLTIIQPSCSEEITIYYLMALDSFVAVRNV